MPFDPSDRTQLDTLFNQTMRGPFSDYSPDRLTEELTRIDLAPGGISEDNPWPLYLQGLMRAGLMNDSFLAAPPDGDGSTLDNTSNRLPGWKVVDGTTDSSGYIVWNDTGVLNVHAGASIQAGDRVYLEQTVYVPGYMFRLFTTNVGGNYIVVPPGYWTAGDWNVFAEIEWTQLDGTLDTTDTGNWNAHDGQWTVESKMFTMRDRTYAQWATVRVGFELQSGFTAGNRAANKLVGYLRYASLSEPMYTIERYHFTLGDAITHKNTAANNFYLFDHGDAVQHRPADVYRMFAPGFLIGMAIQTDSTISAGVGEFQPGYSGSFDLTANYYLGFDGVDNYVTHRQEGKTIDSKVDYDFLRGDYLDIRLATDSSWSATAGCYSLDAFVLLVIHEKGEADDPYGFQYGYGA